MSLLLDTSVCIEVLRGRRVEDFRSLLTSQPAGSLVLCSVVVAELRYGAKRSGNPPRHLRDVDGFSSHFPSLPFDDSAARDWAEIRYELDRAGTPIGPNDLLIAAIARANDCAVVTGNVREFERVSKLAVVPW